MMIYFIKEKQLQTNLKKFGFTSYDSEVLEQVNNLQQKVTKDLLQQHVQKQKQHQKKLQQSGGRVSMPIDYFGGQTNGLSQSAPGFTDVSANNANLRQEMPMNDPSGAFGTEKAMMPLVGGKQQNLFKLSDTAAKGALKKVADNQEADLTPKQRKHVVDISKQKFESVMTSVLQNIQRSTKDKHLSQGSLKTLLSQKKYKQFKA
jgi:hypothetical protein